MSPCDSIIDSPFTIPKAAATTSPRPDAAKPNGEYRGMVTLKKALALSINTVSAKLIDKTGLKPW